MCGRTGEKLSTSHSVAAQASGGILRPRCFQFIVVRFSASVARVPRQLAESHWDCFKSVGPKYEIEFISVLSLNGIFYALISSTVEAVVVTYIFNNNERICISDWQRCLSVSRTLPPFEAWDMPLRAGTVVEHWSSFHEMPFLLPPVLHVGFSSSPGEIE